MKLKVPLVKQPKNSVECGIACVAMLAKYHRIPCGYSDLQKEIRTYSCGTFAPQLGLWFLKHGFDVEIVTMHPALFKLSSRFRDRTALVKHLSSLRPQLKKKKNDRIALEHFIGFVKAGGKLTPRIPDASDIRKEIAAKRPLISLLTHWFLHDIGKPEFTFHFNVITGIDRQHVLVNDPDWGKLGGRNTHGLEEYLYAIYASAYGAADNASIMKIKKRGGS